MEYSYALVSKKRSGPGLLSCSWIAVRSCRWPVTQHEIMSTLTLCSVFGSADVWAGPSAPHSTLGGDALVCRDGWSRATSLRGVIQTPGAIRTGSPLGCLSLQPAPVYSGVSGTASCCGRRPAGGPSRHHSSVRPGSVHFCQPDTPRIPTCLSRDSQGSHGGSVLTSVASD